MHLSIFISEINQLDAQNFDLQYVYFMPLHVSSACVHHQEVKIVLYSLWYLHNYKWPSGAQIESPSQPVHGTTTYMCDDTRGCIIQIRPPDDEHMCSKHVEAWNKFIVNQNFVY